jgi:hypothetical protein
VCYSRIDAFIFCLCHSNLSLTLPQASRHLRANISSLMPSKIDHHCVCCRLETVYSDQKYYPLQSLPFNRYPGPSTLEQGSAATKRAQAQLHKIQESIQVLQARERYLQSVIGQHSSFRSPINRLPDELLLEIFQAIPREFSGPRGSSSLQRFPLDPVWTVSHVCGRWRTVALSCPSLWSFLLYDTITKYKDRDPRWGRGARGANAAAAQSCTGRYELLRLQLERAKQAPLHLTLNVASNRGDLRTLNRILKTWDKWIELTVMGKVTSLLTEHASSTEDIYDLKALRQLTVKGRVEHGFSRLIERAPQLRSLVTYGNDIKLRTPHDALTHLDLRPVFTNCHELLTNTPNVRSLTLRDADFIPSTFNDDEDTSQIEDDDNEIPSTPIELAHLTELSLFLSASDSRQMYNFLVLPSLESLIIGGNEYPNQLKDITDLVGRSHSTITSCTLRAIEESLDELETLLKSLPHLRQLKVYALDADTIEEDADIFRLLIWGDPGPLVGLGPVYVCPALGTLIIDMPEINLDYLALALKSRLPGGAPAVESIHPLTSYIDTLYISAWHPEGVLSKMDDENVLGRLKVIVKRYKEDPSQLVDNAMDFVDMDDDSETSDFEELGLAPLGWATHLAI